MKHGSLVALTPPWNCRSYKRLVYLLLFCQPVLVLTEQTCWWRPEGVGTEVLRPPERSALPTHLWEEAGASQNHQRQLQQTKLHKLFFDIQLCVRACVCGRTCACVHLCQGAAEAVFTTGSCTECVNDLRWLQWANTTDFWFLCGIQAARWGWNIYELLLKQIFSHLSAHKDEWCSEIHSSLAAHNLCSPVFPVPNLGIPVDASIIILIT